MAPTAEVVFHGDDGFLIFGFHIYILDLYHLEDTEMVDKKTTKLTENWIK